MEQLEYNLLFRWFVGLNMDDRVWDANVYSKNRDRLLAGEIAGFFFDQVVAEASRLGLTSDEHFRVDGTLIEAWASQKSFKPKDGSDDRGGSGRNPDVDFRGKPRRNDTHQSTTDPQARLYRKARGQEAKMSYLGHVIMENRNALVVGCEVTEALGQHMEREAAERLIRQTFRKEGATVGGDRGYDTAGFVAAMRSLGVTPHVAQNSSVRAFLEMRTASAPSPIAPYSVSRLSRTTSYSTVVSGRWRP